VFSSTGAWHYVDTCLQCMQLKQYNIIIRFVITVVFIMTRLECVYMSFTVLLIKCDTDHAPRWDGNLVIPGPILPKYHLFR